jgi:predicted DNA binding CopG/RHH family protein
MTKEKIAGTAEAWETGALGEESQFAKVSEQDNAILDDALALKLISIRMQESLIEDLKDISRIHGLRGYQTLIKQVLKRFVEAEKKHALRQMGTYIDASPISRMTWP